MSDWETESGFRENYDLIVYHSYFATDAAYQDGQVILLHWEGVDAGDNEAVSERFAVGSGWNSNDGGISVFHESGNKNRRFNANSIYGRIINWAKTNPELMTLLAERGNERTAGVWQDLKFHIAPIELDFGKRMEARIRNMPTQYLGQVDDDGNVIGGSSEPATVAEPPALSRQEKAAKLRAEVAARQSAKTERTAEGATGAAPIIATLTNLAKQSDSHETFLIAALELEEVISDDELMSQVADDTPTGFYITHS
ncbi:MAG: hypothetical protein ACREBW_00685 [Candidatus Micrarchaeaceae archaeon]